MSAWRLIRRSPAFVALASCTVAAAVGAFAVVAAFGNALWLRPPDVHDPDSLAVVVHRARERDPSLFSETALRAFDSLGTFSRVAGQMVPREGGVDLPRHMTIEGWPRRLELAGVTANYFAVLGVDVRGGGFAPSGDPAVAAGAVISDRLWRQHLGARPDVIGSSVQTSLGWVRIAGVAAAGFHGALRGESIDVWMAHRDLASRVSVDGRAEGPVPMINFCRLRPDMTFDAARAHFLAAYASLRPVGDTDLVPLANLFGASDVATVVVRRDAIMWLTALVSLLLIAAGLASSAAIVLVHYSGRQDELAVRAALGGSRSALAAQLVQELGVIALFAASGAMAIAAMAVKLMPSFTLPNGITLDRLDVQADWTLFAIALGAAVLVVSLSALALARLVTTPAVPGQAMRATSARGIVRFRQVALGGHAAVTVVLLGVALVCSISASDARTYGPGFDEDRTLFVSVMTRSNRGIPLEEFEEQGARAAAEARVLLDTLTSVPGVEATALGGSPLGESARYVDRSALLRTDTGEFETNFAVHPIGRGYFAALGVPTLLGRTGREDEFVISASLAEQAWPAESPLGRPLTFQTETRTVGAVVDMGFRSVRLGRPAVIFVQDFDRFLPVRLAGNPDLQFVVRTDDPAGVRPQVERATREAFPRAVWITSVTGRELVDRDLGRERLAASFVTTVGTVAWGLALTSVFGLVAYIVRARRREFGVMLALGGARRHVFGVAMLTALKPAVVGAFAGSFATVAVARGLQSTLFGVRADSLSLYLLVFACVTISVAMAALLGARALHRLSIVDALRD